MNVMTKLRSLATVTTVATSVLVLSGADRADAATIATAFIDGTYAITTPGITFDAPIDLSDPSLGTVEVDAASTVELDGSVGGSVVNPLPTTTSPFRFSASGSVNGVSLFDDSFDVVLSPTDVDAIILAGVDIASVLGPIIAANEDTFIDLAGAGLFKYSISDEFLDPTGFGATYDIDVHTFAPVGPLVDGLILDLLTSGLVDPSLIGGFTFPSNDAGTYRFDFSVAAIPLPATLPMLAAGGLLLVGLRRRRKA